MVLSLPQLRQMTTELAEALTWMEEYVRSEPGAGSSLTGELALGSALVRNVIAPFLEGISAPPVHVAVVGGAGTGKSTVVNFLLGRPLAQTNPQAGFTRHPSAFVVGERASTVWPSTPGFLGGLQAVSTPQPADVDEDIYQVHYLTPQAEEPLRDCIVWDCPDMTTWAAQGYIRRLLEVTALADLLIYVASDERYNDLVPTQFLHLLVRAGKLVIVVLTKVAPEQASRLIEHFRQEVVGRLPRRADGSLPNLPVLALPWLTPQQRQDPAGAGADLRIPLLNQVLVLLSDPPAVRQRQVQHAVRFLQNVVGGLQTAVHSELEEYRSWQELVRQGRLAFERRYEAEYLEVERFAVVERCRKAWMDMLELPGAGRWLSAGLEVLRTPYRVVRDYVRRWWEPAVIPPREVDVLREAALAWQNSLHADTLRRTDRHPFWQRLAQRFPLELLPAWSQQWDSLCQQFLRQEQMELEQSCQQLLERWRASPNRLTAARAGKLLWDLIGVVLTVYLTGPLNWYHGLLIPLSVSLTHQVVEGIATAQVEALRRRLRQQRTTDLRQILTGPLERWLQQWPAQGNTTLARLHEVLQQAPQALQYLQAAVMERLSSTPLANPASRATAADGMTTTPSPLTSIRGAENP
jgi:GTP-binding protein EngB required for normal cell division